MKKNTIKAMLALAASSLLCYSPMSFADNGNAEYRNQADTLCIVKRFSFEGSNLDCEVGDKLMFMPRIGSIHGRQTIRFVAKNCDLDRYVVRTAGDVTCYYKPVANMRTSNE